MKCPNKKKMANWPEAVSGSAITLECAVQREEGPPQLSCFKNSVKTIVGVLFFFCYQTVSVADPFPPPSLHCSTLNLSPKGSTEPK